MNENKTVNYVFLDESGKPEVFSARGINLIKKGCATKFLVLAAVKTPDQLFLQQQVTDFRLKLLNDNELTRIFSASYTLDPFHANCDYQEVREKFYNFINSLDDVKIDILVVDKTKCFPSLQKNPGRMYGIMAGQLLKNICHQADKTEIIFSRKDSKLHLRQELEREAERVRLEYMQNHPNLDNKFKLSYFHNPHYSHGGLQIADYVAYAIFQLFENKNDQYYKIIKNKIGKIHDICNKKYFTKSNPL